LKPDFSEDDEMNRVVVKTHWGGVVGSGTVQELSQWVEYCNFDGVSPMADLRKKDGRAGPWDVR
jgi:alpha-N-arabinofuranosidase